ncbi:hypothetical protein [Streptomyces sp. NPDC002537]
MGAPGAAGAGAPVTGGGARDGGKPALPRRSEAPVARADAERQGEHSEGKKKTSGWFDPRKSSTPTPPPARGGLTGGVGAGVQGGAAGVPEGASAGFGGTPAPVGGPGPAGTPAHGPQDPSTTAATPWPMDPMGATGVNPLLQSPPPVAAPLDDWPMTAPSAPGSTATGATPWPNGGGMVSDTPADDWPGGASTTGAAPWQDSGQAVGAPADDWPGATPAPQPGPSATGGTPWQGDAASRRAAWRSGDQGDDWPGGGSTTGMMPQQSAPGYADPATLATSEPSSPLSTTGAMPQSPVGNWPGGGSATGMTPQPPLPGYADPSTTGTMRQPPVDDWPGSSPSTTGATPWNAAAMGAPAAAPQGVESTQQFPAPVTGQGAPVATPPGCAAFTGGRTDTPREGIPQVPPPPVGGQQGTPQGPAVPKGQQQKKKQKGGGPTVPATGDKAAVGEALVSAVPAPGGPAAKGPVDSGAPRVAVPRPKVTGAGAAAGVPAPGGKSAVPPPPAPAKKSAPAKSAPKKKGRSKLVLAGGGLLGLVAVAYGAGLLLDHADVPNGTMVLGVAIGGSSKEQAVQKLDSALGDRATAPLKVSIGGKQTELKPEVAGLSIDTQATVRAVSGRDYNPMTVIGSLVGGKRTAEPKIDADEEKIADALKRFSGETGTAREGTIKFEPGKAVPVYGQPYQGLDTGKAVAMVAKAYRDRAATGQDAVVELPSSNQEPKIGKAEVDRMMKSFATPAMSADVTVQTDSVHHILLGSKSLPQILSVKEEGGKLVVHYDHDAIKRLVIPTFAGVKIQRGNGSKTDVTPNDVVVALRKALVGKTHADRIGVIPPSELFQRDH